jgi:hypothetical protein
MGKFLIGAATAALWFVLSHAANAEAVAWPGAQVPVQVSGVGIGR